MNKEKYKLLIKKHIKKENYLKNYMKAFLCGGVLGFLSELTFLIINNLSNMSENNIRSYITLTIILIASLLTSLGVFDKLIRIFRSGLIIPTTGFAHSITSSGIDYKKEGLITGIGGNFFKLAGSVILYSVVVSFVLVMVKVIINA